MKLSVSILASQLTQASKTLNSLDSSLFDFIHIDVMDGHFVPPITFGEAFAKHIQEETNIPLDVHLMVQYPEKEVPKYFSIQPSIISFHYEATSFPIRLAKSIQENNILAGMAINPHTTIESIQNILPYIDVVLVMSVEPGYAGQKFLSHSIGKIQQLNTIRKEKQYRFQIEVDGGINHANAKEVAESGADILVAGSYILQQEKSPNEQAKFIKQLSS